MSQVRKDVLNGWKEIAAYLGRDPRTVERWEKTRSLPVRRMPGSGRSTVYALTSELDQWLTQPAISTSTEVNPPSLPQQDTMDVQVATPSVPQAPGQHGSEDLALAATVADLSRSPMTWIALPILFVVLVLASVGLHAWRAQRHTHPVSRDTQILPVAHPSKVAGVEDLYLRGWYQMELRTPESLARAQEAFQEANKRDPRYAPALAGLACTYLLVREYTTVPEDEAYRMASDAATRAVALDPDLPQAHAALGFVEFFWRWNAAQAEREFELALRLDPKLALAHHWYGSMLTHQGRFSEALDQLGIAQHLDPGS